MKHIGGIAGRWGVTLAFLGLLAQAEFASAQLIPADRRTEWSLAGVPGGIPNRTTIYTTISAGASTATINNAIAACPSDQVVKLSAGGYNIADISFGFKSGVTLRGTLNPDGTHATFLTNAGGSQVIHLGANSLWNSANYPPDWTAGTDITSGLSKGSSNLVVASTSGLSVGIMVSVDQMNDPTKIYNAWGNGSGARNTGQTTLITAINGNTVTIWPPLLYDFATSYSPRLKYQGSQISLSGVEDLAIINGGAPTAITMEQAVRCWLKNVKTVNIPNYHIDVYAAVQCSFERLDIRNSPDYGPNHAGIRFMRRVGFCLVQNCVVDSVFPNIEMQYGSSGNVIAYNYLGDAWYTGYGMGCSLNINHGPGNLMNLYEGNVVSTYIQSDGYFGGSFNDVLFRNRAYGWSTTYGNVNSKCLVLNRWTAYPVIVGNVFGKPGVQTGWSATANNQGANYIYQFGYPNMGNDSYSGTAPPNSWEATGPSGSQYRDLNVTSTALWHYNYDTVTRTNGGIVLGGLSETNIPNSLYLSSKPGWFGNRPWPPIDPRLPSQAVLTNTPAGYRFVFGTDPPAGAPANLPPVAVASANTLLGLPPLLVTFSSAGSSDPEGATLSYSWTFGDGATATSANPLHTFLTLGSFVVRLIVSDGVNSATNTVTIGLGNQTPTVAASASPTNGNAPLAVTFSSAGSSDPDGTALTYNWTFGDGTTSTAANPSHTYSTASNYVARLTVADGINSAQSANLNITAIVPTNWPPVAVASATPTSGAAPLTVNFSSGGSSDPNGTTLTYNWTFGDGTTSTAVSPSHTYSTASNYIARLSVSDGTNTTLSGTIAITVVNPGSGLVAAYGFEETGGVSVTDESGYGNTGTISGATRTTGKTGSGLSFNGAGNLVVVNGSPSLNLSSAMTQEAWVYPTANQTTWSTILHRETDAYYLHVSSPAGSMIPAGGAIYNGVESNVTATAAVPLNTWTHLAVTYDDAAMRLYVNGSQVATKPVSGNIQNNSNPLRIGGNTYGQYFQGTIDEVRIYNRALSASEIQADMGAPVAVKPIAPVLDPITE